jgi:hypothetical protein
MTPARTNGTAPPGGAQGLHPVQVEVILIRHDPSPTGPLAYRVIQAPLPEGTTPDATAARLCTVTGTETGTGTGTVDLGAAIGTGDPGVEVLHSTSWRHEPTRGVVLTYAALPDPRPDLPATALHTPSVVCSGDPLRPAPDVLHDHHIAAHAVRHLA